MGKLIASGVGSKLDDIVPHLWIVRIVILIVLGVCVVLALNYASCSRQEAAQSRQDARSAQAGTKTAGEALDTLEQAQERDAGTDRIVIIGKKEVADAKTDVEADARARAAICRLRTYAGRNPACGLPELPAR